MVLLGVLGVALLCIFTPYNDYQLKNTYLYGNHFPLGCVFLFTILTLGVNSGLRRWRPEWAFGLDELIVFWCMLLAGAGLASSGLMRYLAPTVVAPFYYKTPQNHWDQLTAHMPDWMVPSKDPASDVVRGFFDGLSPHVPIPWGPWIKVLVVWGILFLLMFVLSACLCVLIRRQWVDRERLVFPLIQLPIEMAREPEHGRLLNSFFRSPLMWIGFALPVIVHGINGLHTYFVSLPEITRVFQVGPFFRQKPWWGLGIWTIELYLCVIGLTFLLSTEISFSLWATFLLFRLARVMRVQMAMDPLSPTTPNHEACLAIGGYFAWGCFMLWLARPHLKAVLRKAFHGAPTVDDSDEPLPYRVAVFGGILSFAGIVAWSWAAGFPPLLAAGTFALFTLTLVILSRAAAEGGMLFVQTPYIPSDLLVAGLGSGAYSAQAWSTGMLQQIIFMHDPRENLMPTLINSYRMRDAGRLNPRVLMAAITLAVCVGLVVSFFSFLHTTYRFGGTSLDSWGMVSAPQSYINRAVKNLEQPNPPFQPELWNVGIGGALGAFLLFMRLRFLWWPFHPIGLVLAPAWATSMLAPSIFVAWVMKILVLRFGGLRGYRAALPFFLGMVLGDAFIAGVWALVGLVTESGVIRFLPG